MSDPIKSLFVCMKDETHIVEVQTNNSVCPICPANSFTFMTKVLDSHTKWPEIYKKWREENDDEKDRQKKEYEGYIARGDEYLADNKFQDAIDQYKNAKNLNIDNSTVATKIKQAEGKWKIYNEELEKEIVIVPEPTVDDEYGLCIFLMDASGSMDEAPYENTNLTKKELIAKCAAHGIWDLHTKKTRKLDRAYVAAFMFDHELDVVFPFQSVSQLIATNGIPENLETLILEKLKSKDGQTNINGALELAFNQAKDFIHGKLEGHFGKNYKVNYQGVVDNQTMKNVQFPNVRVFIYTDGEQIVNSKRTPLKNPFTNSKELKYNILMGGYFGPTTGPGHDGLRDILGVCPEHGEKNFFVFDDPSKLSTLKGLYTMATGASGFCPECLNRYKSPLKDVAI